MWSELADGLLLLCRALQVPGTGIVEEALRKHTMELELQVAALKVPRAHARALQSRPRSSNAPRPRAGLPRGGHRDGGCGGSRGCSREG